MNETSSSQLVRVSIPDVKVQKCIVLNVMDTVWTAKQVILDKVYRELTLNPLNYGLYLPGTAKGNLGKFMMDNQLLIDYTLQGNVPKLELRYKRRDYSLTLLTDKAISKVDNRVNKRKLLEYVASSNIKKLAKLLEAGVDPNFMTADGNTPLGLACVHHGNTQCIMPLLSGGSHIDFRGKDGLTPMHRAAIGGNAKAINILLSLGASPNYRDAKGLTPLFQTAITGGDTASCASLLSYRAMLGIRDRGGWTELHHTAKYGHLEHANLLMRYGIDINAQNLVGNTALHVAASHGKISFALLLLKRGAEKIIPNYSGQSPSQVSILCGQHQLATVINTFTEDQIELITLPPDYNPNAKAENKLYNVKKVSEICPIRPSDDELVDTLTGEWDMCNSDSGATLSSLDSTEHLLVMECPNMTKIRTNSIAGNSSKESIFRIPDSGVGDTESISSIEIGSNNSSSTVGTPTETPKFRPPFCQQLRERLYCASPGCYVVNQDVQPQQPGDLTLWKGMVIEVMHVGKGGYWEGKADGKEGWFPRLAINELGDDEFHYTTSRVSVTKTITPAIPEETLGFPSTDLAKLPIGEIPESPTSTYTLDSISQDMAISTLSREVKVVRGSRGYGFAMRGVRATKSMQFQPTPEVPSLQYVGSVEELGAASEAGLRAGDFIVMVNGMNTMYSTHDDVVNIVRTSGGTLVLKVITPVTRQQNVSKQIKSCLTPVATHNGLTTPSKFARSHSYRVFDSQNFGSSGEEILQRTMTLPKYKETVIGGNSPNISRKGEFESGFLGKESPSVDRRYSVDYHPHNIHKGLSSINSFSSISSTSIRSKSFSSMKMDGHVEKSQLNSRPGPLPTTNEDRTKIASVTWPSRLEASKLSDFASPDSQDEEEEGQEEESSFSIALRKSKENILRKSIIKSKLYEQVNTASSLPSISPWMGSSRRQASEEDIMSPLKLELLRANKERSNRLSMKQARITQVQKTNVNKKKIERNSLTQVLSERLDSMKYRIKSPNISDESDFDETPESVVIKSTSMSESLLHGITEPTESSSSITAKSKVHPPAVKPKPFKKISEHSNSTFSKASADVDIDSELGTIPPPFPFEVKCRPTSTAKNSHTDAGDSEVKANSEVSGKLSPKSSEWRVSPLSPTEDRKVAAGATLSHSQSEDSFVLPPPLTGEGDKRISFVDLTPPEAFKMDETSMNSTPLPCFKPTLLPQGILEDYVKANASSPASVSSPFPFPPPPISTLPSKLASAAAAAEDFMLSVDEDQEMNDRLIPIQIKFNLPSPIPSPVHEREQSSLLSISPISPPAFDSIDVFWVNNSVFSSDNQPTRPPFSPQSTPSELSDVPPPLPSEPPPSFDSDTSSQPAITMADAHNRSAEVLSSISSSPRSYDVAIVDEYMKEMGGEVQLEMSEDEKEEMQDMADLSSSVTNIVPGNLKKPEEGLSPFDAEWEPSPTVVESDKSSYKTLPLKEWSVKDVRDWLEDIGLGEHVKSFTDNEMMGEHLMGISKDDMKELGLKKLGHQMTFLTRLSQVAK